MKKFNQILLAAGLFTLAGSALAVPITGTINIGGSSIVSDNGSISTGIQFTGGEVNNFPAPTGDFTGLGGINTAGTGGNTLTLTDFLYTDIPAGVTIWDIDLGNDGSDFSFTLTGVTVVSGDSPDFSLLTLSGTGYFLATGFDKTYGAWSFSQSGASFSSESIPEPAILGLLGLGLIGMGAKRKFRKH